jgi:hypothetical protein
MLIIMYLLDDQVFLEQYTLTVRFVHIHKCFCSVWDGGTQ